MVLASMGAYYWIKIWAGPIYDEKGQIKEQPTPEKKLAGTIATTVYSVLIVVLGGIYKDLAR
jgi:hypothetical protein